MKLEGESGDLTLESSSSRPDPGISFRLGTKETDSNTSIFFSPQRKLIKQKIRFTNNLIVHENYVLSSVPNVDEVQIHR